MWRQVFDRRKKGQILLMARQLTSEHVRVSLSAQIAAQAREIRQKYGTQMGWDQLLRLLQDREFVRVPCEIRFAAEPLLAGEFAHAQPKGPHPEEGFAIYIHPRYAKDLALVPYLVLHQLVLVNFGTSATAEDAEIFGSGALGLTKDEYYTALCALSEQVGGDELL